MTGSFPSTPGAFSSSRFGSMSESLGPAVILTLVANRFGYTSFSCVTARVKRFHSHFVSTAPHADSHPWSEERRPAHPWDGSIRRRRNSRHLPCPHHGKHNVRGGWVRRNSDPPTACPWPGLDYQRPRHSILCLGTGHGKLVLTALHGVPSTSVHL